MSPKIRQLTRLIRRALSLLLSTSRLDCLRLCPSPEPGYNERAQATSMPRMGRHEGTDVFLGREGSSLSQLRMTGA